MNKVKLIVILFIALFFASCQKDTEPIIVYDIQDEFHLGIYQELSATNNVFIQLTTLDKYPSNYRIVADVVTDNEHIVLNIYKIEKPTSPSSIQSFLTKKIKLGSLPDGLHPFDLIIRNNIINEGAIALSPTTIKLDFSSKTGITAKHYYINKIPANSYWGIASVDSSYHAIFLDQFINEIAEESTIFSNPSPGSYGYFSISNQGVVEVPFPLNGYTRTFFMSSTSFTAITDYIKTYKLKDIGFHITIVTADGHIYQHAESASPTFIQSRQSLLFP